MFFSHRHVRDALHSAKRFAVDTYHHGRKFAQNVDGFARLFRRGLSAAAPLLNELGAGRALGGGVRALQEFDSLRDRVVDLDTRGRDHAERISSAVSG